MGQRGPKPLSSKQLKARGTRRDIVRRREQDERTQRPTLFRPGTTIPPAPKGLCHQARLFWKTAFEHFDIDAPSALTLRQAALALDTAERATGQVQQEGLMFTDPTTGKAVPHPLVKVASESRHQFTAITKMLGFYD